VTGRRRPPRGTSSFSKASRTTHCRAQFRFGANAGAAPARPENVAAVPTRKLRSASSAVSLPDFEAEAALVGARRCPGACSTEVVKLTLDGPLCCSSGRASVSVIRPTGRVVLLRSERVRGLDRARLRSRVMPKQHCAGIAPLSWIALEAVAGVVGGRLAAGPPAKPSTPRAPEPGERDPGAFSVWRRGAGERLDLPLGEQGAGTDLTPAV
jgi:hypothetical protein